MAYNDNTLIYCSKLLMNVRGVPRVAMTIGCAKEMMMMMMLRPLHSLS